MIETELLFAKQTFYYEFHHFWVMSYGNRELRYQKTQTKQPLNDIVDMKYFFLKMLAFIEVKVVSHLA